MPCCQDPSSRMVDRTLSAIRTFASRPPVQQGQIQVRDPGKPLPQLRPHNG